MRGAGPSQGGGRKCVHALFCARCTCVLCCTGSTEGGGGCLAWGGSPCRGAMHCQGAHAKWRAVRAADKGPCGAVPTRRLPCLGGRRCRPARPPARLSPAPFFARCLTGQAGPLHAALQRGAVPPPAAGQRRGAGCGILRPRQPGEPRGCRCSTHANPKPTLAWDARCAGRSPTHVGWVGSASVLAVNPTHIVAPCRCRCSCSCTFSTHPNLPRAAPFPFAGPQAGLEARNRALHAALDDMLAWLRSGAGPGRGRWSVAPIRCGSRGRGRVGRWRCRSGTGRRLGGWTGEVAGSGGGEGGQHGVLVLALWKTHEAREGRAAWQERWRADRVFGQGVGVEGSGGAWPVAKARAHDGHDWVHGMAMALPVCRHRQGVDTITISEAAAAGG